MIGGYTQDQIDHATKLAKIIIETNIGAKNQIECEKNWWKCGDYEYFDTFYNYHKCISKALFALLF